MELDSIEFSTQKPCVVASKGINSGPEGFKRPLNPLCYNFPNILVY